jgi:lipoprotein signal peptidase
MRRVFIVPVASAHCSVLKVGRPRLRKIEPERSRARKACTLASKTSAGASFSRFYPKKGVFTRLFFLFLLGFLYFFFIEEEQWRYGREQKGTNQAG